MIESEGFVVCLYGALELLGKSQERLFTQDCVSHCSCGGIE